MKYTQACKLSLLILFSIAAHAQIIPQNLQYSNLDSYSTTETLTNKIWIDGKMIYRKVVYLGNLPNASTKLVQHGITGVSTFVNMFGIATCGQYTMFLSNSSPVSPNTSNIWLGINGDKIQIDTGYDRSCYTGYAIIEYTKF